MLVTDGGVVRDVVSDGDGVFVNGGSEVSVGLVGLDGVVDGVGEVVVGS